MVTAASAVPPIHRINEGTKSLDREIFHKSIPVLAVRVPAQKTDSLRADLKKSILVLARTRCVERDPENNEMRLLLLKYQTKDELPAETIDCIEKEGLTLVDHKLELNYDYWTADDILHATLPQDLCAEAPAGFAQMGHLAHLNLNKEYLPYKYIIGQVILDKNPRLRTVVNKLDNIHTQFRFFDMELIAGEPDFLVQHIESRCHFSFDFREVYWNSRLQAEHERLVQTFRPQDGVIADVMAGVGPFAIPAAKKGCAVLANDLNPNSVKWLRKNVDDNRVSANLRVYCQDGRDFIRSSVKRAFYKPFAPFSEKKPSIRKQKQDKRRSRQNRISYNEFRKRSPKSSERPNRNRIAHFVMNLPDNAIEFLDAFRGIFKAEDQELLGLYETMPLVHCYCFTNFLDPRGAEEDIRKRVEVTLGWSLEDEVSLHCVRSVAPNKDMYCISFRLPRDIAIAV
ncbi:hypothetical protein ACEPAG_541 [Sanghuangporus baumii]